MNNYDDIINLEHHVSKTRTPMSLEARSAQFAPFSALTGYSDAIKETARLTDKKIELDEDSKTILDSKFQILENNININPEVTITCFVKDKNKSGGSYNTITGILKKIDIYNGLILLYDKTKISLNDIYNIESELFKNIDY